MSVARDNHVSWITFQIPHSQDGSVDFGHLWVGQFFLITVRQKLFYLFFHLRNTRGNNRTPVAIYFRTPFTSVRNFARRFCSASRRFSAFCWRAVDTHIKSASSRKPGLSRALVRARLLINAHLSASFSPARRRSAACP